MMPLATMLLRVCSICSLHSIGTLHWACWMERTLGSVLKGSGNACFNATMSWTTNVEQGAVTLVDSTLWADFRGLITLGVNGVQGLVEAWKVYLRGFCT